ncbi:hypothetical protein QJS10_CPB12g00770 [Acorus calamus]|uniref:Uncharacterized protein n=1 Tax=Acorus calamus TaxID=4465 RepID=A0AAV9DLK4_ACOCL|nr:hypothetical protein QJS10_CPB12g00770 [Acorus calamus]
MLVDVGPRIHDSARDNDDQVQVIGLLCRTPQIESRHELFEGGNGAKVKVHLLGANQADDILEVKIDNM